MSDNVKVIVPRNEVVLINSTGNPLFVKPLSESEKLVEVGTFNDYVKPIYDEVLKNFIESATPEEIAIARPTPLKPETPIEETLAREIAKLQNRIWELEHK